jgi:hypothetical protein
MLQTADYECGAQSLDCRSPPRRSLVLACRHLWPEVGDVLLLGRIGRPGRLVVTYLSPWSCVPGWLVSRVAAARGRLLGERGGC